ncbi:M48 family metallopeptidase [Shimia ponticola]|uniref:M48 family metallopeptidase n=1 Tax=Shimia ponticola TaxID=2582893 RepID=UPI0021072D2B|nr:SprT family zinc-dependent metalloprotease [Shimia ponticola]
MADSLTLEGDPPITVHLRRSVRARRLSLRVSRLDGRVTMTVPKRLPLHEARAFAVDKQSWLTRHLAEQVPPAAVVPGAVLPFQGQGHEIVPAPLRSPRIEDGRLLVPERDSDRTPARVAAFLKAQARERLVTASDHYSGLLGRPYARMTLRDTRSRWGSCSSQGALMYSWRLIMAPPEVLNYVAAHEVAHLAEMNHSPAFWAIVERLFPDHAQQKLWLRKHGHQLQRWQFA